MRRAPNQNNLNVTIVTEKANDTSTFLQTKEKKAKQWTDLIEDFFEIKTIQERELVMAARLRSFFKNIKIQKIKKRLLKYVTHHLLLTYYSLFFMSKGFTINIKGINTHLLQEIASFLGPADKYKVQQLSKAFKAVVWQPWLWREINLYQKNSTDTPLRQVQLGF